MGKGDLKARTGRGAPWLRALSAAGMAGQVGAAVLFVVVSWSYLDHPLNARSGSWYVPASALGGGALFIALAAFTAAATYGTRRTAVIASIVGLAWSVGAPMVAFPVAFNSQTLDSSEELAPFGGLMLLFAAVPTQVACLASTVGFVAALVIIAARWNYRAERVPATAVPYGAREGETFFPAP